MHSYFCGNPLKQVWGMCDLPNVVALQFPLNQASIAKQEDGDCIPTSWGSCIPSPCCQYTGQRGAASSLNAEKWKLK